MSFSVNLKEFKNLLQKVYPVVPVRTPYNVLFNLKFVIEDKQLKVYATDIDTSIVAKINIDSDENHKFVVNAKKIYDWTTISSNDENQNILIDVDNNNIVLTRGKSKSNFACVDVNDYPEFQTLNKDKYYEFSAEKIKYISGKVCNFSASKEAGRNRGSLEGVFFDCSKERLITVATDANKLSIISFNESFGFEGNVREIVPTKPINEVAKIVETFGYESIKFSFFNENILFFADDFELITKLVEGQYPDYEKVIPKEYSKSFSVERQELINALRITMTVADKTNNLTKFYLENNELRLHSEDINTNSKSDEFLYVDYPYEQSFIIGFNAVFLIEILSAIDTQTIKFEFVSNLGVSLIRPVYSEEDTKRNILFLLTPLRI
ncbi:MAG: DNA polymerase III subunit beta [Chitinispirillales bacterium]|jgi:DNA polymerase-3 subunit beta|nr:DNA polymerase III subunit beta [Chitinispirillales bacterium]